MLKQLLHPVRAANIVRTRIRQRREAARFAAESRQQFHSDPRFSLSNIAVTSRPDPGDDAQILHRICNAWAAALQSDPSHNRADPSHYHATEWWQQLRRPLQPVLQALETRDIRALQRMYANFFHDPCSTGLVPRPYGLSGILAGRPADIARQAFLGDALHRLDHWFDQTGHRFPLSSLAGPTAGNPFGLLLDGVLIRTGSEFQHYCAQRILGLDSPRAVAEIGGGYGGAAYYVLRDGVPLRYIGFDVPESIALTSYFLLKAFPSHKVLLYGEQSLTPEALRNFDIILMPTFQLAVMPTRSVDITFSSHAMSDLAAPALAEYLIRIRRITTNYFWYCGNGEAPPRIARFAGLCPIDQRHSNWDRHRAPLADETECLYRIG
jgi:hypothetical protein